MVIELKKGYTIESYYDKFTDSYITRLLDPERNQIRDALYSGDMVGRNYDIQSIRDFFKTYMSDPNFNVEPVEDFEDDDSIQEEPVEIEESLSLNESLDVDTAYVIRNDGEVFKCESFHPYIKESNMTVEQFFYESAFDVTLNMFYKISKQTKVVNGIKALVNSFVQYHKDIEQDVNTHIDFDYSNGKIFEESKLLKLYDLLNDLTNQEFCRVRTSSMYGNNSNSSNEVYIRISSEGFDWSDIIYKFVANNSKFISSITIDKDSKSVNKPIVYVHKGQKIDHMPTQEFLSLPGRLMLEGISEDELERKARKTKKATRKAKLPMTRIMPDYGAGIDKFNSFTADGNSGMASTTGSTGLGEAYVSRDELIRTLKKMGFKYKFDKYSDKQLFRIVQERQKALQKKEAEKKKQEYEDAYEKQKRENSSDSYFRDGIEFESEDAARDYFGEAMEKKFYINDMHESWMMEDEPVMEAQPLNESAEKKDNGFRTMNEAIKHFEHKHFDNTCEDLGIGVLYESMRDRLSSDDIKKLGAFMNHAQDPDEVLTYMKGLLSDDKSGNTKIKTESLEEEFEDMEPAPAEEVLYFNEWNEHELREYIYDNLSLEEFNNDNTEMEYTQEDFNEWVNTLDFDDLVDVCERISEGAF